MKFLWHQIISVTEKPGGKKKQLKPVEQKKEFSACIHN
jgi:hypothetical protein